MRTPSSEVPDKAGDALGFLWHPADEGVPHKTAWKKVDSDAFEASAVMREAFPDLLTAARLNQAVMRTFNNGQSIVAMVAGLDPPDPSSVRKNDGMPVRFGKLLGEIVTRRGGLWGQLDDNLFGAVLPAMEAGPDAAMADMIRKKSKQSGRSVSIGIASHPLLDYEPGATLINAAKALDHAAFFGPDSQVVFDDVSLNISGDVYYQDGDLPGAIREFKTALRLDPRNVNVLNSLGVCYGVRKKHDDALKLFEEALRYNESEIMAIYNAGIVHMLADRRESARDYFLRALAVNDGLFEVLFQLGRLSLDAGNPEQARGYLEKAVTLAPRSSAVHRFLGLCHEASGLHSKAVEEYKKAVKINPGDAESISALGYLFEITGENLEIALTFGRKSVELDPENGLYRLRLGRQYLKANRFPEALEAFEDAVRLGVDAGDGIATVHERMKGEGADPCGT